MTNEHSPTITRGAPTGRLRDENDWNQVRWGRERHHGFPVGRYLQPPPFFFTADGGGLPLVDLYRGRSLFLIASGPSFADDQRFPKTLLRQPGIVTLGLNNSPRTFRPNLWASVDSPSNFCRSIWLDPSIQKFVPICHTGKKLLDNDSAVRNGTLFKDNEQWEWMTTRVIDCPNVVYYRRNEHFKADQFLFEDTINWGSHKDFGGGRSVLLAAIRISFLLGFRRVFLLGVDFEMTKDLHYSFAQHRHDSSIRGNNSTYTQLVERFTQLKPYFDAEGFSVFNCNPRSKLGVFPTVDYREAVAEVQKTEMLGIDYENENTEGLYDREYRDEQRRKKKTVVKPQAGVEKKAEQPKLPRPLCTCAELDARPTFSEEERQEVKERLDRLRTVLQDAKEQLEIQQRNGADSQLLKQLEDEVVEARRAFRTCEDEKRFKHGEDVKWGLWKPEQNELNTYEERVKV